MKRDLRLMLLIPVASAGCVLLAIRDALDALDTRYASALNPDEGDE